ncbi:hypothetical protein, partial [Geminicoccus harenae]
ATQNNLGIVLHVLGERRSDRKMLEQALVCVSNARAVYVNEARQIHRAPQLDARIAAIEGSLRNLYATP